MNLFGTRSLRSVVNECRETLGGRAKRDELIDAVRNTLTMAEFQAWCDRAFRRAVLDASKSTVANAGADAVYAVDEEVATLRLFTFDEFKAKARSIAQLSKSNRSTVTLLAEQCNNVHGRTFDVDEMLAEVAS